MLCVDEKPEIQAIDGTAPVVPMQPGQPEQPTPDYVRHGTRDLFAALDIQAGTVIGELHHRHRSTEFRRFLETVEHQTPSSFALAARIAGTRPAVIATTSITAPTSI